MKNKFYVTTPIYYVNDVPHIGHTYTTVAADILARFHRLLGDKTFFLTGTDEHGAKVAEAAKEHKKDPQTYCDEVAPRFEKAWKLLNIEFDHFIRTTMPEHEKLVQDFIQRVYDKGYIYKGNYEGLYCVGCEKFLTESDLVDGKCPLHPNKLPVKQSEQNYFFKLSAFEKELIEKIGKDEIKVAPPERKNEILGKLKLGLSDISISRAEVSWGIPIPWDKKQTIYVWFDALLNYYTATKIWNKEEFWAADLHLVGKDILWFHSVIWPAMLLAVGEKPPKEIFAHGYFTINGQKMSKSLGNVISPEELVEKFGTDGARYLLFTDIPFGLDGDVSWEKFKERYNSDLANSLGNTVQRIAKLCEQNDIIIENKITPYTPFSSELGGFKNHLENLHFELALEEIKKDLKSLEGEIEQNKPWSKSKNDVTPFLKKSAQKIKNIAYALQPFMPQTSEKILKIFSGKVKTPEKPLFPRIV